MINALRSASNCVCTFTCTVGKREDNVLMYTLQSASNVCVCVHNIISARVFHMRQCVDVFQNGSTEKGDGCENSVR